MSEKKFQKIINFSLGFRLTIGLASIILLALLFGVITSFRTNLSLNKKIIEAKEAARPADIEMVILQESSCQDCSDLTFLIDAIKKENVKINSEKIVEASSPEGIELIKQYGIAKVPTLIISGEIEKEARLKEMWSQLGTIKDDTFVLEQVSAPYVLTSSGEVKGRIKLVMISDTSCSECYDVTKHEQILRQFGMPIQDQQVTSSQVGAGRELVAKYKIKLLPTIILTGDVEVYPALTQIWSQVGTIEEDGTYIFREGVKQMGIYKDLTTNQIVKAAETNQESSSFKQIKITGSEFSFNPASLTVKKGENIQLTFTNNGAISHDFVLDELGIKTKLLSAGQSEIISFTASKSGIFSFYCSVGGHRSAGMEGQLTVQ